MAARGTVKIEAPKSAAIPAAWGTEELETLQARDLTDKNDLVGVPFLIVGFEREHNSERDYVVGYVTALDVHGTEFQFSDTSSTGVKFQLEKHIAESGRDVPAANTGDVVKLRIPIMKGLRVSEFKATGDDGKTRNARTYYLTGSMA
jgi:hypothetical protein